MEEYWATRTGRWRKAMLAQGGPTLAERLYMVVKSDVSKGELPVGALLPPVERVARELMIPVEEVRSAYARLVADNVIVQREGGELCVPPREGEPDGKVGDATQIRFEAALLRAVREAAARGLTSAEATGLFKAAMLRIREVEQRENYDD